ncbi:MAG: hypothetical protein NT002_01745 [candidate division Zixibacteria bacterium]|jgi:hypothetical protein|nr:hypothetical protein [candidate division Zixibacteria bacterium]
MSEPRKGMSKGCLITLIIASIILVIIIALSIVCYVKRDSIMQWGVVTMTDQTATEVIANPPDSISAEEIKTLVTDFKQALNDKKIGSAELQSIILMYQDFWKDKKIEKEEGLKFVEELRKVLGPPTPPAQ